MVSIEEIIDKANVKELIALVLGNVGARYLNNFLADKITDANQRAVVNVLIGLGGSYVANELASKNPDYAEIMTLAGLAATAVAAQPISDTISDRLTAEIAAATGKPVIVVSRGVEVSETPVVTKKKPAAGLSVGR